MTFDKARKIIISIAAFCVIAFAFSKSAVTSLALEEVHGIGIVTTDSLNVRSGPGKDYDAMGKVYADNVLEVTGVEEEWLRITYNDAVGYVASEYVNFEPDEEEYVDEPEDEIPPATDEIADTEETETETSVADYKLIFGLLAAIFVIIIVILVTIKSIGKIDRDDYDDDDYDEEDDDEDDDDEYDDEDDDDEYDEDDEYDDDEDDDEDEDDEYEYVMVRRPKKKTSTGADARYVQRQSASQSNRRPEAQSRRSQTFNDDFSIDIDPKYFDE